MLRGFDWWVVDGTRAGALTVVRVLRGVATYVAIGKTGGVALFGKVVMRWVPAPAAEAA